MRVGAGLTPVAEARAVIDAARAADEEGIEAVALWDHYHSGRPDWAYVAGWAAWGAIAAATSRVRLVPMVINLQHHDLGRIAKEVATLDALSGGRFELGIGAGDWPDSFAAWGRPFPAAADRLAHLDEAVRALREIWTGDPVTFEGAHLHLAGATVTPPPASPPRIVVGAGSSVRLAREAVGYADEINVYPEASLVDAVRQAMRDRQRDIPISVHADWSWERWPADVPAALLALSALGVERAFLALGGADVSARVRQLARGARASGIIDR
jgi:alkanesulfonate monooxygenase SsuD/methylene tetrahydromethanopterin reductase-like flavin-dependent oxidoreductase (luciferase family)